MTTDQQIQQQLNEDYSKFYEEKYNGKLSIPKDIIDLFKRAIIAMPPFSHKINYHKVKSISNKSVSSLTFGDLHEIIKVTLNTPMGKLYEGMSESEAAFSDAIEKQIKLEKFVLEYNSMVDDFQKKLQMKQKTLQDLSGRNNGMRIIPQA